MKNKFARPALDTVNKRGRYERLAVILLALMGLDRWIVTPVFPAIMADLDCGYSFGCSFGIMQS